MSTLKIKDYYRYNILSNPQISPSGERVAYVQSRMRIREDDYQSDIWILEGDKASKRVTDGISYNDSPIWSPDSKTLMFISTKEGSRALYAYNVESERITKVLEMAYGISFPSWSPDGSKVAFFSKVKVADKKPYRLVKRLKQKMDALSGFIDYSMESRLFVYDLNTKDVDQITPDSFSIEPPEWSGVFQASWSNDSQRLAIASKIQDPVERDINPFKADVYVIDIRDKSVKGIKNVEGPASKPVWAKDDGCIYFVGHKNDYQRATCQRLCKIDLASGRFSILSSDLDRGLDEYLMGDIRSGYNDIYPKISETMNEIYFAAGNKGRMSIYGLDLASGEIRMVVGGDRKIFGFTLNASGDKLCFLYSTLQLPNDIAVLDLVTDTEERLTFINDEFLSGVPSPVVEHIPVERPDGIIVDGWLMKPVGYEEGKKYPTILEIHGGPMLAMGHNYFFEAQWYANNGYAVIFCNPRGSRGYGQKHTYALKDNYGKEDFEDIMAFVDGAIATGVVDGDRLAVKGCSYGGYMTNWVITHTDRFKAAIPEASVSNWMTMYGMSDFGFMCHELLLMEPFEDLIDLWEISPLAYAENVTTPVLIVHPENDMRCPIEQGEQMFVRLKYLGKEVEMVRFPNANHMMFLMGTPSQRVDRLTLMTEFFDRHLKNG